MLEQKIEELVESVKALTSLLTDIKVENAKHFQEWRDKNLS
jgi:hypothetical protein